MVMAESTLIEQPQVTPLPAAPNVAGDSEKPRGFGNLLLRIVLATATTLVSINLWSGGPLLALWVGSRIQTAVGSLSMAAIGATVGVLIVETFLLYRLLAWLSIRYDAAIGRKVPRRQAPWLSARVPGAMAATPMFGIFRAGPCLPLALARSALTEQCLRWAPHSSQATVTCPVRSTAGPYTHVLAT
jgi:hypothetical protein